MRSETGLATEMERRYRNELKLIDVAATFSEGGVLPDPFSAKDLKKVLDAKDYRQSTNKPFATSYAQTVLSSHITEPSKFGARDFYLELHPSSKPRSYKYTFVGGNWDESLRVTLAGIVHNGVFQGLLEDEFTKEEVYDFLVEVGEINPEDFSPNVIGIYLHEAVKKEPNGSTNREMLVAHEFYLGTTFSFLPIQD